MCTSYNVHYTSGDTSNLLVNILKKELGGEAWRNGD